MNAVRKKPMRPEDALQVTVVGWLATQEALGRLTYFAVPNEGRRSFALANLMRAKGLRSGVYDLCILGHFGVGFIELKAGKGDTSENQDLWDLRFNDFDIPHFVCRSLEEVMQHVNGWTAR